MSTVSGNYNSVIKVVGKEGHINFFQSVINHKTYIQEYFNDLQCKSRILFLVILYFHKQILNTNAEIGDFKRYR